VREVSLRELRSLPDRDLGVAVRAPQVPEDALFAADADHRFGVHVDGANQVLVGPSGSSEEVVEALGKRPVIAHDAKSLGRVPQNLAHDTEIGAYLLEPARRAYPFRELTEERGLAADVDDEAGADALLLTALAEWQREEIRGRGLTDLMHDVELPLVGGRAALGHAVAG